MAKTSVAPDQSGRRTPRAPEGDGSTIAVGRSVDGHEGSRTWVLWTAVALLVSQLTFRTWAAWSSWYFLDDLIFLRQHADGADWDYLLEPVNGHFMPVAKLVYWGIGSIDPMAWWPAALFLVVGQALASAACLWMLVTLFGMRRGILPPFALYLFLSLSMPSYMWFIAALQQLPLQVALCVAVGAWVLHARGEGVRWLGLCLVSLVAGLLFWQKTLVVVPLLVYISYAYFTSGGPVRRLRGLRSQAFGLVAVLVVGVAYVAYYFATVPSQLSTVTPELAGDLAETMLGSTLASGLAGGPWQWHMPAPPHAFTDPPSWSVHLSWVVVSAVAAYAYLRRARSGRALLLLIGWVLGTFLLVLAGRGTALGAIVGTDSRYLSDVSLVAALCLGLAFLELPGAPGSSGPRVPPRIQPVPSWFTGLLTSAVVLSGLFSSATYVTPWHDQNAAHRFFDRFRADVAAYGRVEMVDRVVPEDVMSQLSAPRNNFTFLAPLATDLVDFPDVSSELAIVGDDGSLRQVAIEPGVDSLPGPRAGCGWRVRDKRVDVPLAGRAIDLEWWARIGYLSSADSAVTVTAGRSSVDTRVRRGLNNLYLRLDGGFDEVSIDGLDPGTTLCVDVVEIGQPVPGGPLQ
ncbi:hypothetical protein [Nocardioides sp. P5_E3]